MRLAILALLLVAAPAVAQTRVYTNADLGTPLAATRPDPAAAAAILAPYQLVFTSPLPFGPEVVGVYSSPTAGPFGEFPRFSIGRRLDGTSLLTPPWRMTTYVGPVGFYGGFGFSRVRDPARPSTPRPSRRAPR